MIASLPMYDRPETRAATDQLWHLVREELGYGPKTLSRGQDPWADWQSPGLLLSQTCGLPYRTRLRGRVALVGTPDFALEGCPPGYYRSILVVRRDAQGARLADFTTQRFAYNDPASQSGWAAPAAYAKAQGLRITDPIQTGGHAASARAVVEGRADIAAIDAQSWRLMQRHDAFATRLRVLCKTWPTPGLPCITAIAHDPAPIRTALRRAIAALDDEARGTLCLQALIDIPEAAYLAVPTPAAPAAAQRANGHISG
ncbi:phosphate/phosphite/phosphonate ABC transporter substrate-binding protein [Sediminimonas qiaohouensis]|uniref:phosphate/phosphite/phosphonate ABC transporter substrate-binding protein n=1 Tax=Sediminimonas qiaohouensis TaxID=552061 RepID=UPI00042867DB|nr:PhnD/SsuA/transferrin family substrate-binding protein [Sediminimonas qiaohouensis]